MALLQPNTARAIGAALATHGVAQGPQKLLLKEKEAAQAASTTGIYTVLRCETNREHPDFCTRVAPSALCFCGHSLQRHATSRGVHGGSCGEGGTGGGGACNCRRFRYIPFRPEEVGEWWLPRRKGFNVSKWKAKCRCKCASTDHAEVPPYRCRTCTCGGFQSDFLCVVCDQHWEDHDTVSETKDERISRGQPVGAAFFPLADHPEMQQQVFSAESAAPGRVRPLQKTAEKAEKSVRIMPENCGGLGLPVDGHGVQGSCSVSQLVTGGIGGTRGMSGCIRKAGCMCVDCTVMAGLTCADFTALDLRSSPSSTAATSTGTSAATAAALDRKASSRWKTSAGGGRIGRGGQDGKGGGGGGGGMRGQGRGRGGGGGGQRGVVTTADV